MKGIQRLYNLAYPENFGARQPRIIAILNFTNAFKGYRREVIEGVSPILACHFDLIVEYLLKLSCVVTRTLSALTKLLK